MEERFQDMIISCFSTNISILQRVGGLTKYSGKLCCGETVKLHHGI